MKGLQWQATIPPKNDDIIYEQPLTRYQMLQALLITNELEHIIIAHISLHLTFSIMLREKPDIEPS